MAETAACRIQYEYKAAELFSCAASRYTPHRASKSGLARSATWIKRCKERGSGTGALCLCLHNNLNVANKTAPKLNLRISILIRRFRHICRCSSWTRTAGRYRADFESRHSSYVGLDNLEKESRTRK